MTSENHEPESKARPVVATRISEQGLEVVDSLRGAWTRAEYIRRAVQYAAKQGMKGPKIGSEPDW